MGVAGAAARNRSGGRADAGEGYRRRAFATIHGNTGKRCHVAGRAAHAFRPRGCAPPGRTHVFPWVVAATGDRYHREAVAGQSGSRHALSFPDPSCEPSTVITRAPTP